MFRDSRGVVHTVSAADPLDDLPAGAATVLQHALLRPVQGDLGSALERCEAARELLDRWQDAFFAALPDHVDLEEETRWAAEAGLSLADLEAELEDDDPDDEDDEDDDQDDPDDPDGLDESDDQAGALDWPGLREALDGPGAGLALDLAGAAAPTDPDDPRAVLDEELVGVLERELLLLPLRVRLEALVAASELVGGWSDLLADHEKLLGHLVLAHAAHPDALAHEVLADRHAAAHAADGPGHPAGAGPGGAGDGQREDQDGPAPG